MLSCIVGILEWWMSDAPDVPPFLSAGTFRRARHETRARRKGLAPPFPTSLSGLSG